MQSITTAGRSSFWKILWYNIPIYASSVLGRFIYPLQLIYGANAGIKYDVVVHFSGFSTFKIKINVFVYRMINKSTLANLKRFILT